MTFIALVVTHLHSMQHFHFASNSAHENGTYFAKTLPLTLNYKPIVMKSG